jgi:FkbM family methyltransferase
MNFKYKFNLNFILIVIFILITLIFYFKFKTANDIKLEIENVANFDEDIEHISSEQELIDEKILFQTMKFMLKDTEEDDPELIAFVRSLIQLPSENELNLNSKNKNDFSQIGQSKYIDSILNSKQNGFFIEAGGYTGEELSNTLFFELERNWTGLLIEAVPSLYKTILTKNRKSFTINCCLANKRPYIAKFQLAGVLSNHVDLINEHFQNRIYKELKTKTKKILHVPCFSLYTILKAINVNKVDYFSLDVEGSEFEVLKGINLKKIHINSFSVEHNNYQEQKIKIKNFLEANNFTMINDSQYDMYFIIKQ